jgi:guanosine-3',5'-bis(diphosphate) 3'-pyrophosphohydrolase
MRPATESNGSVRVFGPHRRWGDLRGRLELPESTLVLLDDAVVFAVRRHGGQRRPGGEPYVEHLLETLDVLVRGPGVTDPGVLVAGVLHDVVEDTPTTIGEVEAAFGADVARLVADVTKPGPRPGEDREAARRAYLLSLAALPPRSLVLKLADRLSNVQRLETHPRPDKRVSYYEETVTYLLPLAAGHPWYARWYGAWREHHAALLGR